VTVVLALLPPMARRRLFAGATGFAASLDGLGFAAVSGHVLSVAISRIERALSGAKHGRAVAARPLPARPLRTKPYAARVKKLGAR